MQIKNIVLYGSDNKRRILPFELGKVNIITGDSKTGKSALLKIVDYCLGSGFNVYAGVARDHVLWYAITLQFKNGGKIFIARQNPDKLKTTSVYYEQADEIEIPTFEKLHSNIPVENLSYLFANLIGLGDYKHTAEELSRPSLDVTFKHSKIYCFQQQTDIDQNSIIFYNPKREPWVDQAIKDTMPYFLGAVKEDSVILERELAEKKRNLNRLLRELNANQVVADKSIGKIFELVTEAKQVGLLSSEIAIEDQEKALEALNKISNEDIIEDLSTIEDETIVEYQNQLKELSEQKGSIIQDIRSAESFEKEALNYTNESNHQVFRLESINLFTPNTNTNHDSCPLCNNQLEVSIPSIKEINNSLNNLRSNLEVTLQERPRLTEYVNTLYNKKNEIQRQIITIENNIKAIYKEREQAQRIKDINVREGRVLGRISLFLESLTLAYDFSDFHLKIETLQADIKELEQLLSKEDKDEKLESILDQLSVLMTLWAKDLDLEFKEWTIKFTIKYLTLYIISTDKRLRFDQIGSGENWVAYHLLIHFAIHKYFVENNRPVPRFLMLDQISQAYFPPERDIEGTGDISQSKDEEAIYRFYDFIFKRVADLNEKFQVIIIDHANLKEERFQKAIVEEWRNGKKLVPIDWIDE